MGNYFSLAFVAVNKFRQSLSTLKTNDTILAKISKTSEMTKQQLKELGNEAFKVASKYGQSSGNYLLVVQEMARSGYEILSKELGELSLLAQSVGDMTADSANNYLLATDAAYKYSGSVEKLIAALDGANYISNQIAFLYGVDFSPLQSQLQSVIDSVNSMTDALGQAASAVGIGNVSNNTAFNPTVPDSTALSTNTDTSLEKAIRNETGTAMMMQSS